MKPENNLFFLLQLLHEEVVAHVLFQAGVVAPFVMPEFPTVILIHP